MVFDEVVATMGISRGQLMMYIIELWDEEYVCNEVLHLGTKDSLAIHSILSYEKFLFMADSFNNKIYKYDLSSKEVYETNVGRDPRHMCMDNKNMYVANFESDNISIIDLESFTLSGSIPAGIKAHDVKYNPINNSLYTTCYEENLLMEYSIEEGKSRNIKTDGKPMHLFLQEDTIIVMTYYVNGNIQTKINLIDINEGKITDIIVIEGLISDFQLDYENNILYMINIMDKCLYMVDAEAKEVIKKLYMGGYPEAVTIGNCIYVTNSKKQEITLIDKKGLRIISSVELNFVPDLIKVIHY